jgi:hypothetical protein
MLAGSRIAVGASAAHPSRNTAAEWAPGFDRGRTASLARRTSSLAQSRAAGRRRMLAPSDVAGVGVGSSQSRVERRSH